MRRRQALVTIGATLTAGCSRFRLKPEPDPAAFTVSVSAPSTVTLGESFDVRVAVTNTGGRPGTYTGTVRAFDEMSDDISLPVSVGPVPAGETRERVFVGGVAGYAGRWAVALDDASQPIDVFPATADEGEAVEVVDGFRIVVDGISVRGRYDYVTSTGESGSRDADEGFAFIFASVQVENIGPTGRYTPSRSEFAGTSADGLFPVHFGRVSWDEIIVAGRPYPGKRHLEPGTSLSGWVLLTVADSESVAVVWNRDRVSSPPEALWRMRPTSD